VGSTHTGTHTDVESAVSASAFPMEDTVQTSAGGLGTKASIASMCAAPPPSQRLIVENYSMADPRECVMLLLRKRSLPPPLVPPHKLHVCFPTAQLDQEDTMQEPTAPLVLPN